MKQSQHTALVNAWLDLYHERISYQNVKNHSKSELRIARAEVAAQHFIAACSTLENYMSEDELQVAYAEARKMQKEEASL